MADRNASAATRISVRLTPSLATKLRMEVSVGRKSESAVVRDALDSYFKRKPSSENCYDAALRLGVIGCVKNAPSDLSTNRKYLKGFGE